MRASYSWTQELRLHPDKEQISQSQQQNAKHLPTNSILRENIQSFTNNRNGHGVGKSILL